MRFIAYYSSSAGNFYEVRAANGERLLIDPGVTWKKILKALNYNLENLCSCLVTHEHLDHCKAVEDVLDAGIKVYMSEGTQKALDLKHRLLYTLRGRHRVKLSDTFEVFPFDVEHDAAEPLGFVITEKKPKEGNAGAETLLFVTDSFMIRQRFGLLFDIIALCCNYDGAWLKKRVDDGTINETYAKRLLESHMEKEVTKSYLRDCCCLDKCTEIHLLHMSGTNIDKETIRAEIEKEFMIKTYIVGFNSP